MPIQDAIKKIEQETLGHLSHINDYRDFLKERLGLEKEYASRLEGLAKKYLQKHEKRTLANMESMTNLVTHDGKSKSTLIIGDETGLHNAWCLFLRELDGLAQDRSAFCDNLNNSVIEPLKKWNQRWDEWRKKQSSFITGLWAEKDKVAQEVERNRSLYEDKCVSLDIAKHKYEKCPSDKQMAKLKKAWQEEVTLYHNIKNDYILSLYGYNNLVNKLSDSGYHSLLELYESAFEYKQRDLKTLFLQMTKLETDLLNLSNSKLTTRIQPSFDQVQPVNDARNCLLAYNSIQSIEALYFKSSPNFNDEASITFDTKSKLYLMNKMIMSQDQFLSLEKDIFQKNKEIEGLSKLFQAYQTNNVLGDPFLIYESIAQCQRQLIQDKLVICRSISIIETVKSHLEEKGFDTNMEGKHSFKTTSFPMLVHCDVCKTNLWGVSKNSGLMCSECGFRCHNKCQMKVPLTCTGHVKKNEVIDANNNNEKLQSMKLMSTRSGSPILKRLPNLFQIAEELDQSFNDCSLEETKEQMVVNQSMAFDENRPPKTPPPITAAIALYSYESQKQDELNVQEGDYLQLLEPFSPSKDWIKASCKDKSGLIPLSYIQPVQEQVNEETLGISTWTLREPQKGKEGISLNFNIKAVALFDYEAQSSEELSFTKGQILSVFKEGDDGWSEGTINGQYGLFPSNYVESQ